MSPMNAAGGSWMRELRAFSRHSFMPARIAKVRTALMVIDMQRVFLDVDGDAYLPDSRIALPQVKALLAVFRRACLPVVFTRHEDRPGDHHGAMGRWWHNILEPGDLQLEITPSLEPLPTEEVVVKHQYSAFYETGLRDYLSHEGIGGVVITGVMTHLCCETTARDAFMENLDVTLVVDGMASSSAELHLAALKTLVNGFGVPVLSRELIRAIPPAPAAP